MRQKADDLFSISLRFQARKGNKGLDFRREDKVALGCRVIKGLDSQAVTGAEKTAAPAVPDGKGVHALQARQAGFAPAHVGMQEHFRICAALKVVTLSFQFLSQLKIVVDFTIKHYPGPAVVR